jgi:hypothetical protein
MSAPRVIVKVTGRIKTVKLAGDIRYLDETQARADWQFVPLSEVSELIGKKRKLFMADPGGAIVRIPAEIILALDRHGVMRPHRMGIVSSAYAEQLEQLHAQGKTLFQRIVVGIQELRDDHGYVLARARGTIVPLTWTTQLHAAERGWTAALPPLVGMDILADLLRDMLRSHGSTHRAIKTMTSPKKVGRDFVAVNLTVAPHPQILDAIRRAGQPVDKILEAAAHRVLEKMERKRGAKIVALASTHVQDSKRFRPHLHIRMTSNDSRGKPIALFDNKAGTSRGGRCLLQDDIEREMLRTIERWEPIMERK